MPIYEYQCPDCDRRFELLRSVRDAKSTQPCPDCDTEAERVISRQWSAYTFREGWPRRLPDNGGYWHFEKRVTSPISGPTIAGITHPELNDPREYLAPVAVEEVQAWEEHMSQRRHAEADAEIGGRVIDAEFERERASFVERLAAHGGSDQLARATRSLMRRGQTEAQDLSAKTARLAR